MVFSYKQSLEDNIAVTMASVLVDLDVESLAPEVHKEDKLDFSATRKLYSYVKKRVSIVIILSRLVGIGIMMIVVFNTFSPWCLDVCSICGFQESSSNLSKHLTSSLAVL